MNRAARREQLRDWRRLTFADQLLIVGTYGLDAVPAAVRDCWSVEDGPEGPVIVYREPAL